MRVNEEVNTKWRDMTGEIHIPQWYDCPKQIRPYCEKILTMYTKLGSSCPTNYHDMTGLDKLIMLDYWKEYDGLNNIQPKDWQEWFREKATAPEWIRRSRENLQQHKAIFPKPEVVEHAYQASENFRHSVKSR